MTITGCSEIDAVLKDSIASLFYGEAGIGKTTMLLTIARNLCRGGGPCIYVSTEDVLHYDRVARHSDWYENVLFIEVREYDEFLDYVVGKLLFIPYRILFIDSINALYRIVAYKEDIVTSYGLVLGLLWRKTMENSARLYASAQVRASYREDDIEVVASGMSILEYWFNSILRMDRDENGRFVEVIKPRVNVKKYFMISEEGIEWIS